MLEPHVIRSLLHPDRVTVETEAGEALTEFAGTPAGQNVQIF